MGAEGHLRIDSELKTLVTPPPSDSLGRFFQEAGVLGVSEASTQHLHLCWKSAIPTPYLPKILDQTVIIC